MSHRVLLTDDAARDLQELFAYIAEYDSPANAQHVLSQIEQVLNSLAQQPHRGAYPKELLALGIREYREVFFKPYRLIYRVLGEAVYVYLIVDGRRDMQSLLSKRLFKA